MLNKYFGCDQLPERSPNAHGTRQVCSARSVSDTPDLYAVQTKIQNSQNPQQASMAAVTPEYLRQSYAMLRDPVDVSDDDLRAACAWFTEHGVGRSELVDRSHQDKIPYSVLLGLHKRGSLSSLLSTYLPAYPPKKYADDEKKLVDAGGLEDGVLYEAALFRRIYAVLQWSAATDTPWALPDRLVLFYRKHCPTYWRDDKLAKMAKKVECARPFSKSTTQGDLVFALPTPQRRPRIVSPADWARYQQFKFEAEQRSSRTSKKNSSTEVRPGFLDTPSQRMDRLEKQASHVTHYAELFAIFDEARGLELPRELEVEREAFLESIISKVRWMFAESDHRQHMRY